jgi:hypothetical protein
MTIFFSDLVFALLDLDPLTQLNLDPIWIQIRDKIVVSAISLIRYPELSPHLQKLAIGKIKFIRFGIRKIWSTMSELT